MIVLLQSQVHYNLETDVVHNGFLSNVSQMSYLINRPPAHLMLTMLAVIVSLKDVAHGQSEVVE